MSTTAFYFRHLVSRLLRTDNSLSNRERVSGLDLSLKVAALLASADGQIDSAEIKLTQEFYAAHEGSMISEETIRRAITSAAAESGAIWQELGACGHLSAPLREDIYIFACRAAAADGKLHDDESALLQRIGETLGIAPARRTALAAEPEEASAAEPRPLSSTEISRFNLMINSRGGQTLKRILNRFAHHEEAAVPNELRSLATDLTLTAMALMCLADSNIEQAELRLMSEIYTALGNGAVAQKTLERAAAIVASEPQRAWLSFEHARKLDEATRRDILRSAYQVAQVDGQFDPLERTLLERLATCMQLPAGEIELLASA
jgi:tellurite resistance protein